MDITFINSISLKPDLSSTHIGQMILKQILEPKYSVEIINFDYLAATGEFFYRDTINQNVEPMASIILKNRPKIVGFYTICHSFLPTLMLAKKISELDPKVKIIFGGPHASLTADYCLNTFKFIDAICIGESELIIMPLMDALINNNSLDEIHNIKYRKNNVIHTTPRYSLISSDELTNYTVYDYPQTSNNKVALEGGRGCPFSCTFCSTSSFWGRQFRVKPSKILLQEMNRFHQLYGITKFNIVHDMFTANKAHIKEFCNMLIEQNCPYTWECSSRIDVLTPDIIDLMVQSKCTSIYLGIETGSPRMQKILNKNLQLKAAYQMISYIQKCGIDITVSFIFGFPDESVDDLRCTLEMIERLFLLDVHTIQLHKFFPLPQTIETEKILNQMYFNRNDVDLSIFHKRLYDEESLSIVKKHPILFSQFYTFHTEVRDNYSCMDFLEILLNVGKSTSSALNYVVKFYIRELGLEKLYLDNKSLILPLFKDYESSIQTKIKDTCILKNIIQFFDCIVQKYPSNILINSLYLYARDFVMYLMSDKKDAKLASYSFDIKSALSGIYKKGTNYVRFFYDTKQDKYRSSIISSTKLLYYIINNLT